MTSPTRLTRHLDDIGESYLEHMRHALTFAGRMFAGSFACLAHALLPFCFEKTASHCIVQLHDQMVVNRRNLGARKAGLAE